ncbi:MAG TPA: VOC family protein [Euzebyales bacterium]|nr:VOC family protein [Euzebyales bacterium]
MRAAAAARIIDTDMTTDMTTDDASPIAARLSHAATMLVVSDVERALGFYRDLLGFEQLEYPHIPLLRCGNLYLHLVETSPPTVDKPEVTLAPAQVAGQTPVVMVFEVDDAVEVHRELASRGVPFLTPPQRPPWGGLRCFARDPDGYLVEIEQPSDPTV